MLVMTVLAMLPPAVAFALCIIVPMRRHRYRQLSMPPADKTIPFGLVQIHRDIERFNGDLLEARRAATSMVEANDLEDAWAPIAQHLASRRAHLLADIDDAVGSEVVRAYAPAPQT
jgi:hypothetical protein